MKVVTKQRKTVAQQPPQLSFEEAVMGVRETLLNGLEMLRQVAKGRDDSRAMKGIEPIAEALKLLPERVMENHLPAPVVRLILNDARLDSIIVYSGLRVSLIYDHQELIAPNEKLRDQVREGRGQGEHPNSGWIEASGLSNQQALMRVQHDLKLLEDANRLIRLKAIPT